MLNQKIVFILSCLALIGCVADTQAQQNIGADNNIQKVCEKLTTESGKDYQVVLGEVVDTGLVPPKPAECLEGDCDWLTETSYFFVMRSLEKESQLIYAYTKPEQRDILLRTNPYMIKNKVYAFCGNELVDSSKFHAGNKVFSIDYVNTIQSMD